MKTYVYILLDPRFKGNWRYDDCILTYKPFYVGIGLGYRMTVHFTPKNKKYDTNFTKLNIIDSIKTKGLQPIAIKLYTELERENAKKIEISVIKHFGKIIDNTGILSNITDGGDQTKCNQLGSKNLHSKKVYQYSISGDFMKEWDCLREIGRVLNKSYNNIGDCCRGKTKSAYDFQWFYEYKGIKINCIKARNHVSLQKNVFKFDLYGDMLETYPSLTKAAIANKLNKSNLGACIKNQTPIKKFYFSYNSDFIIIKPKKIHYHKIMVDNTLLILTNSEIVERFGVSKYYIFEVNRGRIKNPKFTVVE